MCKAFEILAEKRAEEKKIEVLLESIKSLMENLKFIAEQAMVALNASDKDKMILRTRLQIIWDNRMGVSGIALWHLALKCPWLFTTIESLRSVLFMI